MAKLNAKLENSTTKVMLSYLKREKNVSFGARDFCRQRATRCENVTQYYQAADTMIGCLLLRDCCHFLWFENFQIFGKSLSKAFCQKSLLNVKIYKKYI